MKGIIESIIYGQRKKCPETNWMTCPACGCRTVFVKIVENRGVIACQECVRENA